MNASWKNVSIKVLLPVVAVGLVLFLGMGYFSSAGAANNHFTGESIGTNNNWNTRGVSDGTDYDSLWQEVNQFQGKGLPKSALETVVKIYKIAKEKHDVGQLLKALIHKMRYLQEVEEDTLVKVQKELNEELKDSSFPVTPVLHSFLAEQYWNYYSNNRYRILHRTQTSADFKQEDIRTWDARRIVEAVMTHYAKSLEQSELSKKVKIDLLDVILKKGMSTRRFRPTLFDFLAHRAVDFYRDSEAGLTKPAYQFTLNHESFFSDTGTFVNLKLETKDKFSFDHAAIVYLQQLARFHLKDNNPDALVDVELKRLAYIYRESTLENKDRLYEQALRGLLEKYEKNDVAAEIYHALAKLYYTQGDRYAPLTSDDYKWHKKKAYDLCMTTIKTYPHSFGTINCKNLVASIKGKQLQLTKESAEVPFKPSRVKVNYRNIDKLYLKIVRTDPDELLNKQRLRQKDTLAYYIAKDEIKKWQVTLPDDKDFQPHSTEIEVKGLDLGMYAILASSSPNFDFEYEVVAYDFFDVTEIAYIHRRIDNKAIEFHVLHRTTGLPLKNVTLQTLIPRYNKTQRRYQMVKDAVFHTDENGYVKIYSNQVKLKVFHIQFIYGKDRMSPSRNFILHGSQSQHAPYTRTIFFTDRSIYRPGQTVYFKGIMMKLDSEDPASNRVLPDASTRVTLYDVNRQKVAHLDLKSNEYGTFSGTFQLPVGRLNGNMRIDNGSGSTGFSMEEYKRPKFHVSFEKLKKSYRVGERVIVKGSAKAYAGFNIDGAEVKYRVVRRSFFPFPWYYLYRYGGHMPESSSMEITNGSTLTKSDGSFEIEFDALPDPKLNKKTLPAFTFTVQADVTDINGETRSGSDTVYIGYTALKLGASLPQHIDKDEEKQVVPITSTTLGGEFIPTKGNIDIYLLKTPDRVFRQRLWQRPDKHTIDKKKYYSLFPRDLYDDETDMYRWSREKKVFSSDFDTGREKIAVLSGLNRWETGKYLVELTAKDRFGTEAKQIEYFTLYSSGSSRVPYSMPDWFSVIKGTAEPGENAVFLIGSSEPGVRVIYEIEHRNRIIEKKYIRLKGKQKKISIPILEEHRGNLGVHFSFIRHNRIYMHSETIQVPWSNKKLDISFETFRDKLQPGQSEEWRIKLKGPKGDQVAAEMVAALYDASLDAFKPHQWQFNIFPSRYAQKQWTRDNSFGTTGSRIVGKTLRPPKAFLKKYDRLNWFGFYWRSYNRRIGFISGGVLGSSREAMAPPAAQAGEPVLAEKAQAVEESARGMADMAAPQAEAAEAPARAQSEEDGDQSIPGTNADIHGAIKARTNFNETAFFFPQLKTTPQGEIVIAFKIPDALTEWKMMGFAHTRGLEYGFLTNRLVTQKELMIEANAPRFLRENDTLNFTAKLTNLSEKDLNCSVRLQLMNAETMEVLDNKLFRPPTWKESEGDANPQEFVQVKKGESNVVSWRIHIPDNLDAVTYRITAAAGNFTDGEEKPLPILSNRMMVTESMPLPVRALQEKTFTFKKLVDSAKSDTLKHHRVTLEFTSNPVWYAVQALPYLMEYPHECMEQVFSRYYANRIAGYIVNSNPKIKRVFDLWKKAADKEGSANANALLSNLEKNQELKSVLLQETPWVIEGKNETQRKRRIAMLFDLNQMTAQQDLAIKKLKEGQLPSGGWPWFKGMRESRYITQHIVSGFAHLMVLKTVDIDNNSEIWQMMREAVGYLDRQIMEDYRRLVREDADLKLNHLRYTQIQYLYARSYFQDIPMLVADSKGFEYFKAQARKYWNEFHRNKYMQGMISLVMKRYGDDETALAIAKSIKEHALYSDEMGMYWKTSYGYNWYQLPIETHALLIEMFDQVLNDEESVDQLKTWLLKQKQTQDWKTTKATAEACYALLLKGDQWLKESKEPEITLGPNHSKNRIHIGGEKQNLKINQVEAGTGYFKTSWTGKEVSPEMGVVTVKNNNKIVAWGSLYWQYFEQLDKITPHKTPLHIDKKLFVEKPSDTGPVLVPVNDNTTLHIGDRIKVRIELRVDRTMEYVHMKDMRASTMEPEQVMSGFRWQEGLGYYQSTKDASTNFFFDYLYKGTYVFEYPLRVTHSGNFSNGITTIQCMYAPEFTSHSEGVRVKVGPVN